MSAITKFSIKRVYDGFFKLSKVIFSHKTFNGEILEDVNREVFERNPVVFFNLYDPIEKRALFVKQLRIGAISVNPEKPYVIEPVAGIIEKNQTPIEAALREAKEESGVTTIDLDSVKVVSEGFTSAGGSNEYGYNIIGHFDSSTFVDGKFGLESEKEDVWAFTLSIEEAIAMVKNGEINSISAITAIYYIQANYEL
jgi:ADP-ribose pyrophosphatase